MDFYKIGRFLSEKENPRTGKKTVTIKPIYNVKKIKDYMVRGGSFYAIWDEKTGQWSQDEYDVARLIDDDLDDEVVRMRNENGGKKWPEDKYDIIPLYLSDYSTKSWKEYLNFSSDLPDNFVELDGRIIFANEEGGRNLYSSKRVGYSLDPNGTHDAYDKLIGTLYLEEEKDKLDWALGAVLSGNTNSIQKFIVLYGEPGTGKSTFLNIVEQLTQGYWIPFDPKAITSNNNAFSMELFRSHPLVAINHDTDLSKIEDNSRFNSLVSHEIMEINEKNKPKYPSRMQCLLFMGTNKPVKVTDAKAGIIRRMIDVSPSGNRLPRKEYDMLIYQIKFELGAIASYCINKYTEMGKTYYDDYKAINMMYETDNFFNFVEDSYDIFSKQDYTTLDQAFKMYNEYCAGANVDYKMVKYRFRAELKDYFMFFEERTIIDGLRYRSVYRGFKGDKIFPQTSPSKNKVGIDQQSNMLTAGPSLIDKDMSDCLAQYANDEGFPIKKWFYVKTTLADLDTRKLHWVKPPENHIVIDFDLKDNNGNKSLALNLEASSKWPPTYTELSKSGEGIHLHYIYDGDVSKLAPMYAKDIEVKIFTGGSALRRKLSRCNNLPMRIINSGLPLKEEKPQMVNFDAIKSERVLRNQIERNLRKEYHGSTASSVAFIEKILLDAYNSGLVYDITDMRPHIMAFAASSTNQSSNCLKMVARMKFKSDDILDDNGVGSVGVGYSEYTGSGVESGVDDRPIIFYDVEVFPNLFIVCWKAADIEGDDRKREVVKMINPTSNEIEPLLRMKLVGFNNRKYDNHILYARSIGYSNEELYKLSQRMIVNKEKGFGPAYNISYTDVHDFCSTKKKLKEWEIELDLIHKECRYPWDEDVPESAWDEVADYCVNDVIATEALFNARKGDWIARQILAELANASVNETTNNLVTKIIFGEEKNPKLVYTDLATGEQW